ncbi:MAG: response regulator transcription factor [Chloroflexi bacterium]|nr:response regulator transcription factor [Chloroflexota bacterium]
MLRAEVAVLLTADVAREVRIVVADSHDLTRAGVCSLIEARPGYSVIGQASHGPEAIDLIARTRPDVVLLDATMPTIDGLDLTRHIRHRSPGSAVVLMAVACTVEDLLASLRAGALGYVLKDVQQSELMSVIDRAVSGEHAIEATLATGILTRMAGEDADVSYVPDPLTVRELEILTRMTEGETNREMAEALVIAIGTVKIHVEHILAKLHVSGRTEAAVRAVRLGIVPRPSDPE